MTERTQSEIFEAYELERAALGNAKDEMARLQEFRPTLLQTATVDEIIEQFDVTREQISGATQSRQRSPPRA